MNDLVYARSFVLVCTKGFKPMELYHDCVQDELNELVERKDKLAVFLTKDKPSDIDVDCCTDSYILWLSMLKC